MVATLEEEVEEGRLANTTVLMATDNSTVEAALNKGNSSSEKLFDLVVQFRLLEIKSSSNFFVTHVSGKRMMAQDTDGLSRGQMREGFSLGKAIWICSALGANLH